MLDKFHISILIEFGLGGVFEDTNINVDTVGYIIEKKRNVEDSFFMNLQPYKGHKNKDIIFKKSFNNYINNIENKHNYKLNQNKFKLIDGAPYIYWISDSFREKFKSIQLGEVLDVKQGLGTSDNFRFLRFYWEVNKNDISKNYQEDKKKWVPYQKGGEYKKWYGNNWLLINWEKDGKDLKNFKRSTLRNQTYYFKEGITYTLISAKGISFRYMKNNNIFDVNGSCLFLKDNTNSLLYTLGISNSILTNYIISCLNPTAASQVGDLVRIPFVKPEKELELLIETFVKENIEEKERQYKYEITEREFEKNPLELIKDKNYINVEERLKKYKDFKFSSECKILMNEALIDELVFKVYDLTEEDIEMVHKKEGIPVGKLPILKKDKEEYLSSNINELNREKINFINNLQLENNRNREDLTNDIKKLYLNLNYS